MKIGILNLSRKSIIILMAVLVFACGPEQSIDRKSLVNRHNVAVNAVDTLGSLTVGNGGFAFTADFTGLQSYPDEYALGVPLGTQSDWGWHSFPNEQDYKIEETLVEYPVNGRNISYSVQVKSPPRRREAVNYFRTNPHRLHLGIIGLDIRKADGEKVAMDEIGEINQVLDLWRGEIRSSFSVLGEQVEVITLCHPELDAISFRASSKLISGGQIKISLSFPYPSGMHTDMACNWEVPEKHQSHLQVLDANSALIERKLDTTTYFTSLEWSGEMEITEAGPHEYKLSSGSETVELSVQFSPAKPESATPLFQASSMLNAQSWLDFWTKGGIVDFSGSTDPRAAELERRVILSQYLTRVQCAGAQPPQETGLTYNSWYGKFHLEMAWWHMVHFYLWNRPGLMEESLAWYSGVVEKARSTAVRQGFDGIRWQKMTDPYGNDSPSSVGSFLIWQQPHYIYFAELCYRHKPDTATLYKYKDLVFETADFMASYPWYNEEKERYELGPSLIPAQECFSQRVTINPPFELSYWYWGLKTAIRWAERLGETPDPEWKKVLAGLSPLYATDGLYTPAESTPRAYLDHTHMHDHPAVLGAFGAMPESPLFDIETMQKTFDYVWDHWEWEETWGWDFPLTAMTAVRLGRPERAMDALFMQPETNTYLPNGHNYQDGRLRLYLPGNGGLLTTVAMMCAGYDGCTIQDPGIPKNGKWQVKWEDLAPMP